MKVRETSNRSPVLEVIYKDRAEHNVEELQKGIKELKKNIGYID